ncbi:unnamed protein product [Schistosoma curassoni]|uniref:Ovule protein n=1 Tax=Schistosoma curassoni TaxID=6186 RepID=A0A183JRW5_9TREM|nr:unnamed protein product [Schistosoma curassoni]
MDSIPQNETSSTPVGPVKRKKYLPSLAMIAPKIHSYLCRLYCAEALTYLDKYVFIQIILCIIVC